MSDDAPSDPEEPSPLLSQLSEGAEAWAQQQHRLQPTVLIAVSFAAKPKKIQLKLWDVLNKPN